MLLKYSALSLALLCLLTSPACKTTPYAPGADPVIVETERQVKIARDVFSAFLKYEHENRPLLGQISPDIGKFANFLRTPSKQNPTNQNFIQWLEDANSLKLTYKQNKNEQSKSALLNALALISAALTKANEYLAISSTGQKL